MKQYKISPSSLSGTLSIPSSKSHTLRAILFGTLAKGKTTIHGYLPSTDTYSMVEACRLFGANIEVSPSRLEIEGLNGKISCSEDVIHAGNSGIVLRFCAAVGALASLPIVITGDHSIRHQRPVKPLLNGLTQLGATAWSMRGDDFAPLIIKGPLRPGQAVISGEDSQPVSALLIAAAFANGPIHLEVTHPGELPWIALTLDWFDRLGISYRQQNYRSYQMEGPQQIQGFQYEVPGDLSSAAFPIAAALVTQSELTLNNVDLQDSQGDKALIFTLQQMGAQIDVDAGKKQLRVRKGGQLKGLSVDINAFVDALPILAVVGCFAEGQTHLHNGAIARHKECDRIQCIATELRKMGAILTETEDGLLIERSSLKGAALDSHQDHRLVMSLSVAAMGATGESTVGPVECISKTFPSFSEDFRRLGADIAEIAELKECV